MKLILCLDDRRGIMFNGRRQSADRVLRERIENLSEGQKLYMSSYSAKQFENKFDNIVTNTDFFDIYDQNAFYFAEDRPFSFERADEIIIYRWNRHYPADVFCTDDPVAMGFSLYSIEEFPGSSHEKITEEKYRKQL